MSICELFGITLFLGWNYSCSTLNTFPIGKEVEFPCGSNGKESACSEGDLSSVPGWERSPGEWDRYPLQYSCLENSVDGGAWQATVDGVAKSQTQLSNQHFHFSLCI